MLFHPEAVSRTNRCSSRRLESSRARSSSVTGRSTLAACSKRPSAVAILRSREFAAEFITEKNLMPLQAGDVPATYADVDALMNDVGFRPATSIEEGVSRFVRWYREYHGI